MDESFVAYKNKIGERVTRTISEALAQGAITEDQATEMAEYILEQIEIPQNNAQLLDFLTSLATKWPLFGGILTLELGQAIQQKDQVAVAQAEELIKDNRIDDALKIVEDASVSGGGIQNG